MTHLIHILGAGPLGATRYRLDDQVSGPNEHIALALAELIPLSRATLLATPKALEQRGQAIVEGLKKHDLEARVVEFPEGSDPSQQWTQFERLQDALLSGEAGGETLLDITHGYRSAPFMAGAVVSFVQAVSDQPLSLRIVYGAFDREAEVSPIWDLSVVGSVQAWARDLRSFLRTGRATEAANALEALGRDLNKQWAQTARDPTNRPKIGPVAKALRNFSENLQTVRTGALLLGDGKKKLGCARALGQALDAARDQIVQDVPPLAAVLDQIDALLAPFSVPLEDLAGPEGHGQVAALAELYQKLGRPLEALATLAEGRVTLFAPKQASIPGHADFDGEARRGAGDRAGRVRDGGLVETRNDTLHAGYRSKSMPASTILAAVEIELQSFRNSTPERLFLNLSNHPITDWPAEQLAAAAAEVGMFPERDPVERWLLEIPFPAVDPAVSSKDIAKLADDLIAKEVPETVCVAMIQGEFTLTVALVRRLQAKGVHCIAATNHRQPRQEGDAFTFGAFRAYEPD